MDAVLAADEQRRDALSDFEGLRAEQKGIGRQIAAASDADRPGMLARAKGLAEAVKEAERRVALAEEQSRALTLELANIIDPAAPVGTEADFVTLSTVGEPRDFATEGFRPRDHVELGRILGAIDVERAAKVSGSRFYYLTGVGALLEMALVNLAMHRAVEAGLVPMLPPVLVRPAAMEGTGFLGQAAENVFHLADDDYYLVGTSEVPLAAYHADEILDLSLIHI